MPGLRVELEIGSPASCPVAETTAMTHTPAKQVTWSENGGGSTEQFSLEGSVDSVPDSVSSVFEYGNEGIYQFKRSDEDCPCEQIESSGHPVADVRSTDGSLFVTLHLDEGTELSDMLAELQQEFEDVSIRTISRDDSSESQDIELVPVNRSELTDRQRQVLEEAYAMGYFDYPRQANATEVAEALDICPSTLAEHLAAAQSKVFEDLIGDPSGR